MDALREYLRDPVWGSRKRMIKKEKKEKKEKRCLEGVLAGPRVGVTEEDDGGDGGGGVCVCGGRGDHCL